MLRIVFSLASIAAVVWLPIIIYVFLERKKPVEPPALKVETPVAHQRLGRWYLVGDSSVPVKSIRDICEWLLGCEYVPDLELFGHPDLWQHPLDFEAKRQGDCEDHWISSSSLN